MSVASPPGSRVALWKAIGWSVAFLLLGWAITFALLPLWALATAGSVAEGLTALTAPGGPQLAVLGVAQLVGFALATWLIGFRVLGLGRDVLRWTPPRRGVRGLGFGLGLGSAAALLALASAVLVAHSHWSRDTGGAGDWLSQVLLTTLVLAPAALSEEIIFRGLPLVLLAGAIGRGAALVVVAGLVFAAFHGLNPGVTALGLGNIALAGIFLGLAFYAPGGLWTAFGAHLGWNVTLAALDAPVSGLPFRIPFLDYHAGDPVWLSGGRFGPEGGLLATGAITAALLVLARRTGPNSA